MRRPADLPSRPPQPRRRFGRKGRIALVIVAAVIVVLFLSARSLADFYVNVLWFQSVDHADVFWTVLRTRVLLASAFAAGFALVLFVNLTIADRLAPILPVVGPDEPFLERYRELVAGRQTLLRGAVAVVFGLIAGMPASGQWSEWLLFRNAVNFGVDDPQFGTDVSFYVFRLPFLTFVVSWLFASLIVVILLTTATHYLNGGIRLQGAPPRVTPQVKLHLSLLLAGLALLRAAGYWLQRYELTTSSRGFVQGANYTDVKAQLPALNLLILISLLAVGLLIYNVRQKGWRLPIIAVGLWAVVASVAGTLYPAFVERFQVEPNVSSRERPYIQRNIEATRAAYGLDVVETVDIEVGDVLASDIGVEESPGLTNTRIVDPAVVLDAFQVLRGTRTDYRFNDLDVDRYVIDGRLQQVVLSARELNSGGVPVTNWEGVHLAYTHGYGVVAAPASRITGDGRPDFVEGVASALKLERPEIYFGDNVSNYSVVRTNRPDQEQSFGTSATSYEGTGGVRLSSRLRRAAFALHFGEYNLFGSRLITSDSRILYVREVRDRVSKVAPFLALDADPYPVVVDGRVLWVLDAYTTSSRYPYSQDADRSQLPARSGLNKGFNYVRNSVKAVVDAYEGTVTLYLWDEADPIVVAWSRAFPELFTARAEMPEDLLGHLRYPEDLFRIQTNRYSTYHLDTAGEFINQDSRWSVAQEAGREQARDAAATDTGTGVGVTTTAPRAQRSDARTPRFDPYYTMFTPPGSRESDFVLLRPFVPYSENDTRQELQAVMTASSERDTYGQLTVYRVNGVLPLGPTTVSREVQKAFSEDFSLLNREGTRVLFGDMQLVPVGEGLLYVRPIYIKPEGANAVPEIWSIAVTYGDRTVRGDTLGESIAQLFPGVSVDFGDRVGATPPDGGTDGGGDGGGDGGTDGGGGQEPGGDDTLEELLSRAGLLYDEAQAARRAGDVQLYLELLEQSGQLIERAAELASGMDITVTPTSAPPTTTASTTSVPTTSVPATSVPVSSTASPNTAGG